MAPTERTATLSSPAADCPAPGGPPRLATHTRMAWACASGR